MTSWKLPPPRADQRFVETCKSQHSSPHPLFGTEGWVDLVLQGDIEFCRGHIGPPSHGQVTPAMQSESRNVAKRSVGRARAERRVKRSSCRISFQRSSAGLGGIRCDASRTGRLVEYSRGGMCRDQLAAVGEGCCWRAPHHVLMHPKPVVVDGKCRPCVLGCVPFWMISTVLRRDDDGERIGVKLGGIDKISVSRPSPSTVELSLSFRPSAGLRNRFEAGALDFPAECARSVAIS